MELNSVYSTTERIFHHELREKNLMAELKIYFSGIKKNYI